MEIFDEMCEKFGLPKFEFGENGSAAVETANGAMLINRIGDSDDVVMSALLGTIGGMTRIHVYRELLVANGIGGAAFGRTFALDRASGELMLQTVVKTAEKTPEALMGEFEELVTLAVEWRKKIEQLIAEADEVLAAEEDDDEGPVEPIALVENGKEASNADFSQFV